MNIDQARKNYEAAQQRGIIHPDHTMFTTPLTGAEEDAFRTAVYGNNAFPGVRTSDIFHPMTNYDYRGLWKDQPAVLPDLRTGNPIYPPQYRTPFHAGFDKQSIYAQPIRDVPTKGLPNSGPLLMDTQSMPQNFNPKMTM